MKILLVNKFFYIKGGSETYYFALRNQLINMGHEVVDFSMEDPKNFESPYSEYFVERKSFEEKIGIIEKIKTASNIIYSCEAKKKFEQIVKKEKPDIVHLHLFQHQISPSILDIIKKYQIPTVYTAHELKMICLNYKMMHHNRICEDCIDGNLFHCVLNRCVKDSVSKSLINYLEGTLHTWKKSYDVIDKIITPSVFYRKKFEEFGIDPNRVVHIPNFLDRSKPTVNRLEEYEKYFIYIGRISEEKGIRTLIKAVQNTDCTLYIVGIGPLKKEFESLIQDQRIKNIRMMGFKSGQELIDLIGNSKAVIIPSEWYENGPYSAIEALQLERPIIGADIGGIPELINGNGFLFPTSDVKALRVK